MASPSQTVRFCFFFSAPRALPLLLHILMTEADVCVSRNPGQLQSLKSLVSSEMSKSYQQVFLFLFFLGRWMISCLWPLPSCFPSLQEQEEHFNIPHSIIIILVFMSNSWRLFRDLPSVLNGTDDGKQQCCCNCCRFPFVILHRFKTGTSSSAKVFRQTLTRSCPGTFAFDIGTTELICSKAAYRK